MATHAGADRDMSIVYFSLKINDKKKIIKAKKTKYWRACQIPTNGRIYVIQNIVFFFSLPTPMFSVKYV